MNKSLINTTIALALAVGTSSALAQAGSAATSESAAQRFADQFADLQAASSSKFAPHPIPQPASGAVNRPRQLSFAEYQQSSSGAAAWRPQRTKPDSVASAPTDPVPPHGLPIADYQALSSDSATWETGADINVVASAPDARVAQLSARGH